MAKAQKHLPCRTCIATRQRRKAQELLRVISDPQEPGRVLPDPYRCLPGRGAWITPTIAAYEQAEKRRAWNKALRISGHVDTSEVRVYLEEQPAENRKKTEH